MTNLDAGTKVRFTAITRTLATGHKFWRMEYNDGGTWKPAAALQTTTETGEEVSYTHAMKADGTTYITVDVTVTYACLLYTSSCCWSSQHSPRPSRCTR